MLFAVSGRIRCRGRARCAETLRVRVRFGKHLPSLTWLFVEDDDDYEDEDENEDENGDAIVCFFCINELL